LPAGLLSIGHRYFFSSQLGQREISDHNVVNLAGGAASGAAWSSASPEGHPLLIVQIQAKTFVAKL
jgi:uncharacterized protein (DUF736 family)